MLKKFKILAIAISLVVASNTSVLTKPWKVHAAPAVSSSWIRGTSVPSIWYDTQSFNALDTIKNNSFNAVRIVWDTSGSPSRLQQIVNKCVSISLSPTIELHDATGGTDTTSLNNCVNYWVRSDVKAVLNSNSSIWVNVANEWGPSNSTVWRDGYKSAISTLRTAGITNVIVMDSGGWGQDDQDILNYANDIMNSNSNKNVMFSVHMYGSWNDNNKIDNFLTSCQSKGIPIMVGEFGYNYNNGNNNLGCQVDAGHLMIKCKSLGIGFMAWSWTGNDSSNSWLDMTNSSDWKTLTWWGNFVKSNMW